MAFTEDCHAEITVKSLPRAQGLRLSGAAASSTNHFIPQRPCRIKEQRKYYPYVTGEYDAQILKFFSAPDLHSFPQQSGTRTPAMSHTSVTHPASDRKSAARRRRQLHSSGASSTRGAVTLPLTPFEQHYFIMSARHNLLLEFATFISSL